MGDPQGPQKAGAFTVKSTQPSLPVNFPPATFRPLHRPAVLATLSPWGWTAPVPLQSPAPWAAPTRLSRRCRCHVLPCASQWQGLPSAAVSQGAARLSESHTAKSDHSGGWMGRRSRGSPACADDMPPTVPGTSSAEQVRRAWRLPCPDGLTWCLDSAPITMSLKLLQWSHQRAVFHLRCWDP